MNQNMHNRSNAIDFFTAHEFFKVDQDSVENKMILDHNLLDSNLQNKKILQKDSLRSNTIQQIDFSAIDSILQQSAEREKLIQVQINREAALQRWYLRKVDTSEILYKQFGIAGFPIKEKLDKDQFQQNFLYNIVSVKPAEKQAKQTVFIESQDYRSDNLKNYTTSKDVEYKPQYITGRIQLDWVTILLLGSFLLLGWVQLFNKKYLTSLIKSIFSFQESNTLYREKNSLMEKASFMVNLLFLSNIAVFVIQLKFFFGINTESIEDYLLYLICIGSLIVLYIFRALSSSLIGFLFLKQKVFSEFFHNVNIYTKNTGLFLFPIVIILQFLTYEYLAFIVYTGIVLAATMYLLHIIRSFQIISRKNVSIFYMILYLCAFEFAPFLIVYKILVSLVE